jgi:hypothetical protein
VGAKEKVYGMFEQLAARTLPDGSTPEPDADYMETENRIREEQSVPRSILPGALQDFIARANGELTDYLTRTVKVLRWRSGREGPHRPFAYRGAHWSLDDEQWHYLPSEFSVSVSSHGSFSVRDPLREKVRELVQRGEDEPLSQELFREAWLERGANPRSALLLGVAAAEIGFKSCVGSLVPDAEWLALNAPSPPLVQMLREYLPLLPAASKIGGQVVPPPDDVLDQIKIAVKLRNDLAHRGPIKLSPDRLEAILTAVADVLWMLDYYQGYGWALENLSTRTRMALGLDPRTERSGRSETVFADQ